jgi:hypothetical protein
MKNQDIPDNVYNDIIQELKHQKQFLAIMNMKYPDAKKLVKKILKKLKLQVYYEHIPYIISKITHKPPPTLSRDVEENIKTMFKQVQEPFSKYCPTNRINFLNYSYILHKFFELLEMPEFSECFPLLKSREKLKAQDNIWKQICTDLEWTFYPS